GGWPGGAEGSGTTRCADGRGRGAGDRRTRDRKISGRQRGATRPEGRHAARVDHVPIRRKTPTGKHIARRGPNQAKDSRRRGTPRRREPPNHERAHADPTPSADPAVAPIIYLMSSRRRSGHSPPPTAPSHPACAPTPRVAG